MATNSRYMLTGAFGALYGEYERAVYEYMNLIDNISEENYLKIVDSNTKDTDCRSISTITNHVINSGYTYLNYYNTHYKLGLSFADFSVTFQNKNELLETVLKDTKELLLILAKWDIEKLFESSMLTTWRQDYDFEQLFEHAIVHILRHRRQVENFLKKLS
jgi:hypothetical protein